MGPTPPGFGEIQEAVSAAAGSMSPVSFFLSVSGSTTRETPTSSSTAPGLIWSAPTMCGRPAAATTTSACASSSGRLVVPVCARTTVALTGLRVSSSPMGRPTVTPRPITSTVRPASSTPWRVSSSTMPLGVHGSGEVMGSLTLSTRRPRLVGCSPSASLAGSIRSRIALVSMCSGRGNCTM